MRPALPERHGQQYNTSAPSRRLQALPREEHLLPTLPFCVTGTMFSGARGLKPTKQIMTLSSPVWRISSTHYQPTSYSVSLCAGKTNTLFAFFLNIIYTWTWATLQGRLELAKVQMLLQYHLLFISNNILVTVWFCWHNSVPIRSSRPAASLRRINVPLSLQVRTSAGLELQRYKEERLLLATFRSVLEKPTYDPWARQ